VLCERGLELRHIQADGTVTVEHEVHLPNEETQTVLFGQDVPQWRSSQSVSHRRRLRTSSAG
jgi:hypothetical protein